MGMSDGVERRRGREAASRAGRVNDGLEMERGCWVAGWHTSFIVIEALKSRTGRLK